MNDKSTSTKISVIQDTCIKIINIHETILYLQEKDIFFDFTVLLNIYITNISNI